ncbi:MAG TPA: hypothetical protein VL282_07055, partial [Tepidisphaeraceae bacterium]|nr:hypothetical protein [Tepidisphaeraceae bacterium]
MADRSRTRGGAAHLSGREVVTIEILEQRTLRSGTPDPRADFETATESQAAEMLAPDSIQGLVFHFSIDDGDAPFSNHGSYLFQPAQFGNAYTIVGSGGAKSGSGIYGYIKVNSNTGLIVMTDSKDPTPVNQTVQFLSKTSGVFQSIRDKSSAQQNGTFTTSGATG